MAEKRKCHQYSMEYLKLGFIPSPSNVQLPFCLLCEKSFSNEMMKPSQLKDHLVKIHSDKADKPVSFFQSLKAKFEGRSTVKKLSGKSSLNADKGLICSYELSLLIAKHGKPHSIGETLILPVVKEIFPIMLGPSSSTVTQSIPLSSDTVSKRIDEMAADVEERLIDTLKSTEFVMQIDESTICENEALLLAYAHFINGNEEIREELLFARNLVTDTKGSSIFEKVEEFFNEKNIPLTNVVACTTDGDASMVGRYREFQAHLKSVLPGVMTVHSVVHRQHLVSKNLSGRLHESLHYVINAVNEIKLKGFNNQLFQKLCEENDEDFEHLLLYTEVRWLSKEKFLQRFHELFDTAVEFLESIEPSLSSSLKLRRLDIAYLADVFDKLNEVNVKLQGDKINFIKAKGVICSFLSKLDLLASNMSRQELYHFPSLGNERQLQADDVDVFCCHLKQLKEDIETRFYDLINLNVPTWVLNPFTADFAQLHPKLQEPLTDLKYDCEAQSHFQSYGYEAFWVKMRSSYPILWEEVKLLILAFPSTYLVERGFSAVQQIVSNSRDMLKITEHGDLRMILTKMVPDIVKLASAHQAQGSH
nr:SCAN domain-containing protein 3-like [Pogona vitticeps]XP_020653393.1 SCAN domain-containing protein 3-like [Pogona vitticeps]